MSDLRRVLQEMTTLTPASSTLMRVLQNLEETPKLQVFSYRPKSSALINFSKARASS